MSKCDCLYVTTLPHGVLKSMQVVRLLVLSNIRYLTCTILFLAKQKLFVLTGQNTIAKPKQSFDLVLVLPKTKTKHKIVQVSSLR